MRFGPCWRSFTFFYFANQQQEYKYENNFKDNNRYEVR